MTSPEEPARFGLWRRGRGGPPIGRLATSFRVRAIVSLAVVAAILSRLDVRVMTSALASVDLGYVLGTIVVGAAARTVMIGRWTILVRATGVAVSVWRAARIFLVSSFVGVALPTGGADVARAYALSKHDVGGERAAASVVIDRLFGISALLTLGVFSFALGMPEAASAAGRFVVLSCFIVAVMLLSALWADRLLQAVMPRMDRNKPFSHRLLRGASTTAHFRRRPGTLGVVFGLSLLVQWLRITEIYLLGAGLGLDIGFGYCLVFMPIGLFVLMLPVSIAGVGLPQGVIMWLLRPAGVLEAQSFALSTLLVMVGVIGTLPGLYLYLRARGGPEREPTADPPHR